MIKLAVFGTLSPLTENGYATRKISKIAYLLHAGKILREYYYQQGKLHSGTDL